MATQFDAISAKLRAMNSVSLEERDYEVLLQKKSVGEVCAYLKNNTGYRDMLSDINESKIHRRELELIIDRKVKDEYIRLYRFVGLYDRKTLKFIFIRAEIEFIKHCLRYMLSNETDEDINLEGWVTPFFREHTSLDVDAVAKAKTYDDFVNACKNTMYYSVLKRVSAKDATLFSLAMMLDGFYYKNMWESIQRYVSKDGVAPFKEYIGTSIDLLNILWIYRSKKYYDTPNEIIYTYIIPVRHRLTQDMITNMIEAENADGVILQAAKTKYKNLFEELGKDSFVEENYKKILYKTARKIHRNAPESMAAVYAYFYMRETEVGNITTIIEGIRYNFSAEAIAKMLIR